MGRTSRLAALLALAAACIAPGVVASPEAVRPAKRSTLHGLIAYSTRGGDIWVMRANGSGRRRLTRSGRGVDFDPSLSPDGKHVVFRSSRGRYAPDRYSIGLEAIRIVDVRTRRQRQIQPWTGGLFPAWSPDGEAIAFSGLRTGGGPVDTIQLMRPDGTGLVDLGMPGEVATWSPDGTRIAFASHGPSGRCGATGATGGSSLTPSCALPRARTATPPPPGRPTARGSSTAPRREETASCS